MPGKRSQVRFPGWARAKYYSLISSTESGIVPSWLTPNYMGLCTVALRGAMCTSAYSVGDKRRDTTIKKTVVYLSVVEDSNQAFWNSVKG